MTNKLFVCLALIVLIPRMAVAQVEVSGLDEALTANVIGHLAALEDLD